MRKIVTLTEKKEGIVRLMIYNSEFETYLFGFDKKEDCSSKWDEWFESEKDAIQSCELEYGIEPKQWIEISNPNSNCKHDRINPVSLPILNYQTLKSTSEKLKELNETELQNKIANILKSKPIEKALLHNKKDQIDTNEYLVNIDNESIEKIIDILLDLEVSNLDETYEPTSNMYSTLVDDWNRINK